MYVHKISLVCGCDIAFYWAYNGVREFISRFVEKDYAEWNNILHKR